jgi:transposase-like protein
MSKRRTHSHEFKVRVAMEAISGRKILQEIAADHFTRPIQLSQWKKQYRSRPPKSIRKESVITAERKLGVSDQNDFHLQRCDEGKNNSA